MASRVVVSGYGIISALGLGSAANFNALKSSKAYFSNLEFLSSIHGESFPFGEIKFSTENLLQLAGISSNLGFTRTSILGILALQEAMEMALLNQNKPFRIGLINATTVGGMCEVERYYFDILQHKKDFMVYSDTIDCADCTHRIADYFEIKDFITTISTACSSSANAIILGSRLLQQDMIDIAICGGTDALSRFTINGFNSLKNIDKTPCKPFDQNRNGLNLGEGAAYLIIEKESHCLQRNCSPKATLSGYANYNEAFHPTAPNPEGEGASQVMKNALKKAKMSTSEIDYINAHGTATLTNDESESNAMKRLFEQVPRFSSTKCFTGHTLAAAGAMEAVYSILALQNQCVYANLHFETPIDNFQLVPQLIFENKLNIRNVMSNSFAFGGNNASLIFSTYSN